MGRADLLALARAYDVLRIAKEARPWLDYVPHERGQVQFHQSRHPIRLLVPGNGFGKTRAAGTEAAWWVTREHPYQPLPKWAPQVIWMCPDYRQWALKLSEYENEWLPAGGRYDEEEHSYEWSGGAKLWVLPYERSWKSNQGINPDLVIFDEEPPKQVWREMRMRRRGWKKTRFAIAATATGGDSWMEKELYEPWVKHHADLGMTVEDARGRQLHPDIWVWDIGGIDDNPGADAEDRAFYHRTTWSSDAERRVRLFGGFATFNAMPVFDPEGVDHLRGQAEQAKPEAVTMIGVDPEIAAQAEDDGRMPTGSDVIRIPPERLRNMRIFAVPSPCPHGRIEIYERPSGRVQAFGAGADFAYGLTDGDFDSLVILVKDELGIRQVAEAHGHWGEVFDRIVFGLITYFGEALLVGESQVGLASLRRLWNEYEYRRLYYRRNEQKGHRPTTDLLGHPRTADDLVMQDFRLAVRQKAVVLRSKALVAQMARLQFSRPEARADEPARDEALRMRLPGNESPDLVMGACYGWKAIRENPFFPPTKPLYEKGTLGDLLGHDILHPNAPAHVSWITRRT